ncbi:MAG: hypothetical protein ACSHXH_10485 [Marivita sp.]|uniref:hypothetical protein n=1 Tax=Marivita sp. TaxID=2003365 RepID=UPI003EF21EAD
MTQSKPPFDDPLDAVFADARRTPPAVPDDLMARVIADAMAEMPLKTKVSPWGHILGPLGGWPAIAGLAMTACVGVWAGGTLTDDLMMTLSPTESALVETGTGLGAFDLLLVDG